MAHKDRSLSVLADGEPFAKDSPFCMSGRLSVGLFPSLFTLQCRNLSESQIFQLRNTKQLSVLHGDSCLDSGAVSDVFVQTVPEGTVTTAAFSLGLDLWEAQVSLSVPANTSVSETVRLLLAASGTGISLLSFPGRDGEVARPQAFCGRAAECIETALGKAGARAYLVSSGLCIIPADPLPATLHLTKSDLTDAPVLADRGKKLILSTTITGFQPGEEMTLEADGHFWSGLILERLVEADTSAGEWKTQLLVQLR